MTTHYHNNQEITLKEILETLERSQINERRWSSKVFITRTGNVILDFIAPWLDNPWEGTEGAFFILSDIHIQVHK